MRLAHRDNLTYLLDSTSIHNCVSAASQYNITPQVIFDVGARDCKQSIDFSNYYKSAKVYSFEPNPIMVNICENNVKNYPNITLVKKAINSYNGTCKFYNIDIEKTNNGYEEGNQGASSLFKLGEKYRRFSGEQIYCAETEVECLRLDTFVEEHQINEIDIIWMDVQAAEKIALESLGSHLAKVKLIHTELNTVQLYEDCPNNVFLEVNEFLTAAGFKLIRGNTSVVGWDDYIYINTRHI